MFFKKYKKILIIFILVLCAGCGNVDDEDSFFVGDSFLPRAFLLEDNDLNYNEVAHAFNDDYVDDIVCQKIAQGAEYKFTDVSMTGYFIKDGWTLAEPFDDSEKFFFFPSGDEISITGMNDYQYLRASVDGEDCYVDKDIISFDYEDDDNEKEEINGNDVDDTSEIIVTYDDEENDSQPSNSNDSADASSGTLISSGQSTKSSGSSDFSSQSSGGNYLQYGDDYTGLAKFSNSIYFVNGGKIDYSYNDSFGDGLGGGWKINSGKVYCDGAAVRDTSGKSGSIYPKIVDDNSFSGRLIIGDSRMVQLYEYGSHKYYNCASFMCVWAGNYYGKYDYSSINYSSRVSYMKQFIKESIEYRGFCNVYLETTVNDYNGGGGYKSAADSVLKLASELKSVSASFCGQTIRPNIYILGLTGSNGVDVSTYNSYLNSAASANGFYVIDLYSLFSGSGYASDGLHYNNATLSNIWNKILSDGGDYIDGDAAGFTR